MKQKFSVIFEAYSITYFFCPKNLFSSMCFEAHKKRSFLTCGPLY